MPTQRLASQFVGVVALLATGLVAARVFVSANGAGRLVGQTVIQGAYRPEGSRMVEKPDDSGASSGALRLYLDRAIVGSLHEAKPLHEHTGNQITPDQSRPSGS